MDPMNIPASLIGVVGEKDAKVLAAVMNHEVADIYICEPSMKDYSDIMKASATTDQSVTDQMGVVACIKDSGGKKLLSMEKMNDIPIRPGIRLCNIVMALFLNLQKEAGESLGKDMETLGLHSPQSPPPKSSNTPSAST